MKEMLISIIVPVYKVEQELSRCVESLITQTYKNIEIILVDDGSPDCCPQMCEKFAQEDNRIRVIHKENGGLSDARNAGLLNAVGDYILYVDSDDYIEQDTCERFISVLNEEADFVAGEYREIQGGKMIYHRHTNLINGQLYTAKDYIIRSIKNNEWYAPAWLNLYKRQFLLDNKLFYKKGIYFEDTEMLPRLCLSANKIQYLHHAFYYYVVRNGSIMKSSISEKKIVDSLSIYSEWYRLYWHIHDIELQRYLYGQLVKHYLKSCQSLNIRGWKIKGVDYRFARQYALNKKEKLKAVLFTCVPELYDKL